MQKTCARGSATCRWIAYYSQGVGVLETAQRDCLAAWRVVGEQLISCFRAGLQCELIANVDDIAESNVCNVGIDIVDNSRDSDR
jgi:hypothetical protein